MFIRFFIVVFMVFSVSYADDFRHEPLQGNSGFSLLPARREGLERIIVTTTFLEGILKKERKRRINTVKLRESELRNISIQMTEILTQLEIAEDKLLDDRIKATKDMNRILRDHKNLLSNQEIAVEKLVLAKFIEGIGKQLALKSEKAVIRLREGAEKATSLIDKSPPLKREPNVKLRVVLRDIFETDGMLDQAFKLIRSAKILSQIENDHSLNFSDKIDVLKEFLLQSDSFFSTTEELDEFFIKLEQN